MDKLSERQEKERKLAEEAKRTGKGYSYIADDGCEVSITNQGYILYNVADWW